MYVFLRGEEKEISVEDGVELLVSDAMVKARRKRGTY